MDRKWWHMSGVCLALLALVGLGPKVGAATGQGGQFPRYECSIKVPEPEPADLAPLAKITATQAMAAAQAAYPGAQVKKVELENENGCLVYAVELTNGLELKVDAGTGQVVHREQEENEGSGEGRQSAGDQ